MSHPGGSKRRCFRSKLVPDLPLKVSLALLSLPGSSSTFISPPPCHPVGPGPTKDLPGAGLFPGCVGARSELDPQAPVGAPNRPVARPDVLSFTVAERAAGAEGRVADGVSPNVDRNDVSKRSRASCRFAGYRTREGGGSAVSLPSHRQHAAAIAARVSAATSIRALRGRSGFLGNRSTSPHSAPASYGCLRRNIGLCT